MSAMWFVAAWLGAYRVTRFVLDDSLIDRWRQAFYLRFPPSDAYRAMHRVTRTDGTKTWSPTGPTRPISKLGVLLDCYWCLGFWVSGGVVGVLAQVLSIHAPVLWWLAVSTAIGLTARNLDGA